jgi:hypothetical protein
MKELFYNYQYPNIKQDKIQAFVEHLLEIIEPHQDEPELHDSLVLIMRLLQSAAEKGSLPFITDEDDHLLVKNLEQFYARPIYMFVNSEHFFDQEADIQQDLEKMELTHNGARLTNYHFLDSKSDKLTQASDIIVGLIGKLSKFVNTNSHQDIDHKVKQMNAVQLGNLDLLLELIEKTIRFNPGFIHYTDGAEEPSKIALLGRLRNKSV